MISIDFVAGSHGNFLEYVCNKHIAGVVVDLLPFNALGSSHIKTNEYNQNKIFCANHYSEYCLPLSEKIVRITFTHNDLLLLSSGAFLRAGDVGIENDQLEINTYHKLADSQVYSELIQLINDAYPDNSISLDSPACPRFVLREYFKFGFKDPEINGFTKKLAQLKYSDQLNVIDFPFESFYNKDLFIKSIASIADWYGQFAMPDGVNELWEQFYQVQVYRNHKVECDRIINSVIARRELLIPKLSLLQESYINGVLEKQFNIEMPFRQPTYFTNTSEIIDHLCLK